MKLPWDDLMEELLNENEWHFADSMLEPRVYTVLKKTSDEEMEAAYLELKWRRANWSSRALCEGKNESELEALYKTEEYQRAFTWDRMNSVMLECVKKEMYSRADKLARKAPRSGGGKAYEKAVEELKGRVSSLEEELKALRSEVEALRK